MLYLFIWREKIVPTLGVVLVDLERLKTTGQILGYRGFDFGAVSCFRHRCPCPSALDIAR